MRITRVERWRVVVPCRAGILEREGRWWDAGLSTFDRVPKWIVRVHAEGPGGAIHGLGESSRGESEAAIEAGAAVLVGRDPRALPLHALPLPPEASYGTFEMAVYDLLGRLWDVPVCALLGGPRQEAVPVDYWASRRGIEETAAQAVEGRRRGFAGIKIKAALADPQARRGSEAAQGALRLESPDGPVSPGDHSAKSAVAEDDPIEERVAAIAAACGPDFTITVDPNCRFYEPDLALGIARRLARFNLLALEDPFPWRGRLAEYAAFRRECPVPVALHLFTPADVLAAIRAEAADCFNLNGSLADFVRMAWLAEQAGLPCWHGSGVDLGIRDAAYLHASLAAANCTLPGDLVGNFLREDDLIREPLPLRDGRARLPAGPGLGVELDEDAVRRYSRPE